MGSSYHPCFAGEPRGLRDRVHLSPERSGRVSSIPASERGARGRALRVLEDWAMMPGAGPQCRK